MDLSFLETSIWSLGFMSFKAAWLGGIGYFARVFNARLSDWVATRT